MAYGGEENRRKQEGKDSWRTGNVKKMQRGQRKDKKGGEKREEETKGGREDG